MYRQPSSVTRAGVPRRRGLMALVAAAAVLITMMASLSPSTAQESTGSDFWIAFDSNNTSGAQLTVFISGDTATSGTVTPKGETPIAFTVSPGAVTSVSIPTSFELTALDGVEDKGIRVQADAPVSVYGLNRLQFTTDAFLAIPTESAGTSYRVLTYTPTGGASGGLGIVATADGTTVTITPSVAVGARAAGVPFDIALAQGQTYQLAGSGDLSGSTITSNLPVSVYGFAACANIPPGTAYCDHVVEQLPPTSAWGTSFLSVRLANRIKGDTYRVLADENDTVVTVDGTAVATLAAGEFFEGVVPGDAVAPANTGIAITTSKPSLVAQYSNGTNYDSVPSDPFMMLIPPFEQFLSSYTITTPATGFDTNFVNLVVPTAGIGDFRLDGAPVAASAFNPIGATAFSSAQVPVALGSHTVANSSPFGVFVYGFATDDSYGYPGGYGLSPVAAAADLTLDQPAYTALVNDQICPVATVTDRAGNPLAGITVTFAVDNPTVTATAVTNDAGQATTCFTSATVANGTLTATAGLAIGTLTTTATVAFTEPVPPTTVPTPTVPQPPAARPIRAQPTFAG